MTKDSKQDTSNLLSDAIGGLAGIAAGAAAALGVTPAAIGAAVEETLLHTVTDDDTLTYWRDNFITRDYVDASSRFEDYAPAYRYGIRAVEAFGELPYETVEPQLKAYWEQQTQPLPWEKASFAIKDAYLRQYQHNIE